MNYTELTAAITAYAEGDGVSAFTADDMQRFVQQAEKRIYNEVQVLCARKSATGNATASNRFLTIPTDCLSVYELAVISSNEYDYLINKDLNFLKASYPDSTYTGKPRYYAWYDQNTVSLAPTPDSNYTMEMGYFYYPESIVTAGTSWLGDNFDQALLWASLYEAAMHMKEEELVLKTYQQRMGDAMAELKMYAEGKQRQDMYRTPQNRVPVK